MIIRENFEAGYQYVLIENEEWVETQPRDGQENRVVDVYDCGHRRLARVVRKRDLD